MAETIKKIKEPETVTATATSAPVITYTSQEFAISGVFSCAPECVTAAFKQAGKTEATLEEAQKLVKAFLTKEVN